MYVITKAWACVGYMILKLTEAQLEKPPVCSGTLSEIKEAETHCDLCNMRYSVLSFDCS